MLASLLRGSKGGKKCCRTKKVAAPCCRKMFSMFFFLVFSAHFQSETLTVVLRKGTTGATVQGSITQNCCHCLTLHQSLMNLDFQPIYIHVLYRTRAGRGEKKPIYCSFCVFKKYTDRDSQCFSSTSENNNNLKTWGFCLPAAKLLKRLLKRCR